MTRQATFALAVTLLGGCANHADRAANRLVITGSSTVAPLVAEIGKRFEAAHPGTRVDVQTGGSSRGIADARNGLADIGMASRALAAGEEDLHAFPIARDGVCVFVHRDNPVSQLTDGQIAAIYTGRLRNWSEVGGADAPITVVNKAEGRATLAVFLDHLRLAGSEIRADVIVGDNEQGIKTVVADPNAIAYVSIGTAEFSATHGVPVKLLPAGGVAATTERLADGSFPLARPLNLVTRDAPVGLTKEFIDFARSCEVDDLARELYFVPVC